MLRSVAGRCSDIKAFPVVEAVSQISQKKDVTSFTAWRYNMAAQTLSFLPTVSKNRKSIIAGDDDVTVYENMADEDDFVISGLLSAETSFCSEQKTKDNSSRRGITSQPEVENIETGNNIRSHSSADEATEPEVMMICDDDAVKTGNSHLVVETGSQEIRNGKIDNNAYGGSDVISGVKLDAVNFDDGVPEVAGFVDGLDADQTPPTGDHETTQKLESFEEFSGGRMPDSVWTEFTETFRVIEMAVTEGLRFRHQLQCRHRIQPVHQASSTSTVQDVDHRLAHIGDAGELEECSSTDRDLRPEMTSLRRTGNATGSDQLRRCSDDVGDGGELRKYEELMEDKVV